MRAPLASAVLVASLVAAIVAATPAQSATELQCSSTVVGAGPSQDYAEQAWSTQAASQLGSAWSNFSLAKNKQYSETDLHLGNAQLWTVSAQACRHVLVVPLAGLGKLQLKQNPGGNPPPKRNVFGTIGKGVKIN